MARNAKLNYFDLTHDNKTTFDMGYLVPVGIFETLPGDWYKISHEFLLRFMPTLSPTMHIFRISLHAWYVPFRILMEQGDWYKFLTGGEKTGTEGDSVVLPYVTAPEGGWPVGSLADHLRYATGVSGKVSSAFPFRAYALIYNENYRNEAVQDPVALSLAQGSDTTTNTSMLKRCWSRDIFTNSLPSPQKGPSVTVPLGSSAPVFITNQVSDDVDNAELVVKNAVTGDKLVPSNNLVGVNTSGNLDLYGGSVGTNALNSHMTIANKMVTDLSQASAATINQLRLAATVQHFQETNMRGGSRPVEFIWNHYGVRVPDGTLQRPLYIGGMNSNVVISEVLQTSQTTTGESGSPQGTMAGHGVGAGESPVTRFHCTEHGLIIFLMSVMPNTAYMQGQPRFLNKTTRYEFGLPLLANIGEQPVRLEELYTQGTDDDKSTFAYNRNYYEYCSIPSYVSGDMKSSLKFWHAAREFAAKPELNSDFVECNPTTRFWAVESGADHLVCQVLHHIDSLRPLPKNGRPGIHII